MAGIIYELIEVLEEQSECYEGLNTLAKYKEQAIVDKQIELLEKVTTTEEEFMGRLTNLDKKRETFMKDISLVLGMNFKEVTITTIASKMQNQEDVYSRLINIRDSIKEELDALKKQSELNKELINQSLEFVDFMVNAIGGINDGVIATNYEKNGNNEVASARISTFDYKQ